MTPPTPSRETPAGRDCNDLRNLARRQGRDPAKNITSYALAIRKPSFGEEGKQKKCLGPARAQSVPYLPEVGVR